MRTVKQMMATLLENLRAALVADGSDGEMCIITQVPGESMAIDYGPDSCGGSAWVRLISANPTVIFPNPDSTERTCAATLAFQIEVGIMRPGHVGEEFQGEYTPPTDVELFNDTDRQLDDMQLMYDAIRQSRGRKTIPQMVIGSYTPIGPDGGVVGGTWQVAIGGDED